MRQKLKLIHEDLIRRYRQHMAHTDRDPRGEMEFRRYANIATCRLINIVLLTMSALIIAYWPLDYFLFKNRGAPLLLRYLLAWRIIVIAASSVYLLATHWIEACRKHSIATITPIMLILFVVLAHCTALVGPISTKFFYAFYLVPFFSVPISYRLWHRLWATVGVTGCTMTAYLMTYDAFLAEPYFELVVAVEIGAVIISVLGGHLIYDLLRMNYFMRRDQQDEAQRHLETVRELAYQRALASERNRIMREVHDGLGSALVSTLALVERGTCAADEIAGSLRYALDDMKIIIDSLDPDVQEITTALGTLRERVEPRLRQLGMRFDWKVRKIPSIARLGPSDLLNISRITQECVTNILKHAEATAVEVMTGTRAGAAGKTGVFVRMTDNGSGFDVTKVASGRGLGNMHARAQRLHGELSVTSEPGKGTSVELWLPFEQQQA